MIAMSGISERALSQIESILSHYDRYVCPYDTLERPEDYGGIVIRDTYEGGTLMPAAFMSDINQSVWRIDEIRTTDDGYLEISLHTGPQSSAHLNTAL